MGLVIFIYAVVFCFIPGSLFFVALHASTKAFGTLAENRLHYVFLGSFFGVLCGASIASVLSPEIIPIFCLVGALAGALTAYLIFPAREVQDSPEIDSKTR